MPDEKTIAGLTCSDVLEALPDYLSGDLAADRKADVETHLRGCDWCERFGGDYAATVQSIRQNLAGPTRDPDSTLR